MFGLCIEERYYMLGKCRIEYFETMMHLNKRRSELDQGVTTWVLGEARPKRRILAAQ